MQNMELGLMLMGYGLLGVFTVLVTFYVAIKIMMKIFKDQPEK